MVKARAAQGEADDASAREKVHGLERIADLAEKLVKISAVLAAFGYMSLRAHLNYLGISSTASLGLERYLMETYNMTANIFLHLFLILTMAVIPLLLIYLFFKLLLKLNRVKIIFQFLRAKLLSLLNTAWVPVILLLGIVALNILMLRNISACASDVAVGDLSHKLADGCLTQKSDDSFYWILIVCVCGYFSFLKYSRPAKSKHANGPRQVLWKVFAAALVALSLQLPLTYGRTVRSPIYTEVQILTEDANGPPISGLLVLESESVIEIWQAENNIGRVIVIPRSRIRSMTTGKASDLLETARASLR